jgi:hypothetical protein
MLSTHLITNTFFGRNQDKMRNICDVNKHKRMNILENYPYFHKRVLVDY